MDINISKEENDALVDTVQTAISDIKMEISHTDSAIYKEDLRIKKDNLSHVLNKLKGENKNFV